MFKKLNRKSILTKDGNKVIIFKYQKEGTKRIFFAPETEDGKRINQNGSFPDAEFWYWKEKDKYSRTAKQTA